eukprot:TRINITY_DN10647_c0_g1_i2.p1 TRINITY_DN10647_c0_g1~~TRINITY_DN10647_c0_g1_i2.p1  ORF type:complete len:171 (-),score=33.03 TRINITY_DN10647_c0_g1_i2:10-522(-)
MCIRDRYLDYVHKPSDSPADFIPKDPDLKTLLTELIHNLHNEKLEKWIFTNSYHTHAERVLQHLEITECFDGTVEYWNLLHQCKPHAQSYEITLNHINEHRKKKDLKPVSAHHCLFFDDSKDNLNEAKKYGFHTVLIGETSAPESYIDFSFEDIKDALTNEQMLSHYKLK